VINIQSALRTVPDLCKNVSLALLFGGNDNSLSPCAFGYIYIHILYNIEALVGKYILKIGKAVNAACHFRHAAHSVVSPGLQYDVEVYIYISSTADGFELHGVRRRNKAPRYTNDSCRVQVIDNCGFHKFS
jgi:hypothetical protein